jgi:cAMP-dependent protein kinase regulator
MRQMPDDLRKLKDEAARAIERGKYRRAAELYDVLTAREADPLWPHRAGEAYRRAGLLAEAVERLGMAAEGYEGQGFISKAIAVCKMILEVDPKHAMAQERLMRLGPRRNTPLMMPAVTAEGVPIRPGSELAPSGGITPALDKAPAALVGRFEFRDLAPGTSLITQGEAVSTLLVVLAGGCDVVFHEGGAERPVALLGPGDLVGAVSLLERKPADVSVRTRTRVWALAMSPTTFREVIVTYPTVLIHVGEVAQQRHARLAQLRG